MICEKCKKNHATVHLTEIVKDVKRELHVCDNCARQMGIVQKFQQFSITELLNKLIDPQVRKQVKQFESLACAHCGLTYTDFRSRGRFGCAQDFDVFAPGLAPLLEKIHGSVRHVGRVPGDAPEAARVQRELAGLQRELAEMKKAENYERCAEIRDRISQLETQMGRAPKG